MKGYLGKFIIMLIMLGMFSFIFIAINEAYTVIYSWAGTEITDTDSSKTVSTLNIMWVYFPVAVLFSYFVYSIRRPQKEREVWP